MSDLFAFVTSVEELALSGSNLSDLNKAFSSRLSCTVSCYYVVLRMIP